MKFIKVYVITLVVLSILAIMLSIDLGRVAWHLIMFALLVLLGINVPTIVDVIRQLRK